ncbi:IclR family transcriptional regulator [Paracoccus sediminicola]|uniref:IclR family transcriptional regulator n=1 Tax=Paracoccus sediminicola TaxID=3017783 RepID=UPI0022EFEDD1|nr:helix-turn-helix domain-containing protein [Paracoccus sediminicola]WBU56245.1 helix-turn-helix domain-containing protein [Paracoccus sediminicola]
MVATTLQTLDRGLTALAALAEAPEGLRPAELAERLSLHKAIAYRLIATLESHGMARRLPDGRAVLGAGLIPLAAKVEKHRLSAAAPHLAALSEATRTTSCVVLADGPNAVVALVQEGGDGFLRVSYRLGLRHPLTRGASGLAILSGRPASPDDPPAVSLAREQGYSLTRGELQQGAVGIAAPIIAADPSSPPADAAVSIVALQELPDGAAEQVMACAAAIGAVW